MQTISSTGLTFDCAFAGRLFALFEGPADLLPLPDAAAFLIRSRADLDCRPSRCLIADFFWEIVCLGLDGDGRDDVMICRKSLIFRVRVFVLAAVLTTAFLVCAFCSAPDFLFGVAFFFRLPV